MPEIYKGVSKRKVDFVLKEVPQSAVLTAGKLPSGLQSVELYFNGNCPPITVKAVMSKAQFLELGGEAELRSSRVQMSFNTFGEGRARGKRFPDIADLEKVSIRVDSHPDKRSKKQKYGKPFQIHLLVGLKEESINELRKVLFQ